MEENVLIFDFDGTIADTFQHLIKISNRLSTQFHFNKVEPHEVEELKNKTSQEVCRHLKVTPLTIPFILAKAKRELHKDIASIQPREGIEKVLRDLKSAGYKIGILTSNSLKNVKKFLETHKLDLFDFIHTSPKFWGKGKGLCQLMDRNNLKPQEVIYIGDETRDIEAAQKAGIRVAAVTWGYNSPKILKKHNPDYLVDEPAELVKLFSLIPFPARA